MHARFEWRGLLPGLCLAAAMLCPGSSRAVAPVVADHAPAACDLNRSVAGAITLKGRKWAYERRLGMLPLHDAKGHSVACLSYVSYSAGEDKGRPVTFFFNGGPGSSGLFLQLGSFGPLRVDAEAGHLVAGASYDVSANPLTLLDASDLVFVDPVGTGFSHAMGEKKDADFWQVDQDAAISADFVTAYLATAHRWNAPLYLFGESYGTTRIAVTSRMLAERGVFLNGLIFMSTILDYGERLPGVDLTSAGYLPSYAAIAWFHHKGGYQDRPLDDVISQAQDFAAGPYMRALWQGGDLDAASEQGVAEQLSRYMGLPVGNIEDHALKIDVATFRSALLKPEGLSIGRYDARATAAMSHVTPDVPAFDPANENVRAPLTMIWNRQLDRDFGYTDTRPYVVYDNMMSSAWDWRHKAKGRARPLETAVTGDDLAETMTRNPGMQVVFLNGLYDLATPFSLTLHDIRHLDISRDRMRQIAFCRYPAGHMMYFDTPVLKMVSGDLHAFYAHGKPCPWAGR